MSISKKNIIIIGPAHPLRGGLASYNERLARAFQEEGHSVSIYTFSLQYPGFLFPGTTQFSNEPKPTDLNIRVCINSINPFNWITVGKKIKKQQPDLVIVRYWLPFMGPCLGTILRIIKKNKQTRIVCIADNIIPHEKRKGDKAFTRYFLKPVDAFVTMSEKVMTDLRKFDTLKPARMVLHPLYDNFGEAISSRDAREHLGLPVNAKIVLFFGFIRKYKGLDLLLQAISMIKASGQLPDMKLLIAGEFYEDRKPYDELISASGIEDMLLLHTQFIADSEVKYYCCAADVLVQPYRNATQSGVTPLAYHFELPMIVTDVGGLPALVPDGKAGLVAAPDPASIAEKTIAFFDLGKQYFMPGLREEKKKYSWHILTASIFELADASRQA